MMSNMDNETLKNIMKSSCGMDLSDSQVEMMRGMMKNPELMKNCMDSTGNMQVNTNNTQTDSNSYTTNSQISNTSNNSGINTTQNTGGMDFSKMSEMMSKNPELMKMAMNSMSGNGNNGGGMPNPSNMDFSQMGDLISKNPELLKMAMNSMGMGNSGADPNLMMNSMQTILWVMSIPQRIKAFFTSTKGILFSLIIAILIISYFYG